MKGTPAVVLAVTMGVLLLSGHTKPITAAPPPSGWDLLPTILKRIVPPRFPDRDFDIRTFGAQEGGTTDCRAAFAKAIAACTRAGGGSVVVPPGTWLTKGPIHLDNNVNLHVVEGATVRFGTRYDDYLPHVVSRCEGTVCHTYSPLIYAFRKTNVAVTGQGTLDGQAKGAWARWPDKTRPGTRSNEALRELGGANAPLEDRVFFFKPNMIEPYECENVLIEGVRIIDYPFWCVHPTFCKNVTVRKLHIDSHNSNNDGINPDSSSDVLIEDCWLDQSDDAIALKAGRDQDAWRIGKACRNIIIRNMPSNFEGVAVGSEMSGGVENVFIYDCAYDDGDILYCKSNLDRGGFIRNIFVRNLQVGRARLLRLRNDYHGYRGGNFPTEFRNIHIENVRIASGKDEWISITGVPQAPVHDVYIQDVLAETVEPPILQVRAAQNVVLSNVRAAGKLLPRNPPILPPKPKEQAGTALISPRASGNWSDVSLWQLGRDGSGLPWRPRAAKRLPDGTKDERVIIGKSQGKVTITLDQDVRDEFDLRLYDASTLRIPAGRALYVGGDLRPDRKDTRVEQLGGQVVVGGNLQIDDPSPAKYVMTGGSLRARTLSLDEGMLVLDNSRGKIRSVVVEGAFRTHKGDGNTTTHFIAHEQGLPPVQCKDLVLENYLGEALLVDVTRYNFRKHGDLVLFRYSGSREGTFDGGPEQPQPRVKVLGAKADLVYDDKAKQVHLTNFRR